MRIMFICNTCTKLWREKHLNEQWYRDLYQTLEQLLSYYLETRHEVDIFFEDD